MEYKIYYFPHSQYTFELHQIKPCNLGKVLSNYTVYTHLWIILNMYTIRTCIWPCFVKTIHFEGIPQFYNKLQGISCHLVNIVHCWGFMFPLFSSRWCRNKLVVAAAHQQYLMGKKNHKTHKLQCREEVNILNLKEGLYWICNVLESVY